MLVTVELLNRFIIFLSEKSSLSKHSIKNFSVNYVFISDTIINYEIFLDLLTYVIIGIFFTTVLVNTFHMMNGIQRFGNVLDGKESLEDILMDVKLNQIVTSIHTMRVL